MSLDNVGDTVSGRSGDLTFRITVVSSGVKDAQKDIERLSNAVSGGGGFGGEGGGGGVSSKGLAWDFMLLGRSVGIANRELGWNNSALSKLAGTMMLIASVMRILIISQELLNASNSGIGGMNGLGGISLGDKMNIGLAHGAIGPWGSGQGASLASSPMIDLMLASTGNMGFVAKSISDLMLLGGFANGGNVNKTGPYLLHEGERVVPKGGPNMSNVNINMRTGPINSQVDVNRMVTDMGATVAMASRRRMGI